MPAGGEPAVIAIIGDTHLPRGSRALPEQCLEMLRAADVVVHTGDFTSVAVLDDLLHFGEIHAVHGNMDDSALRARLPETVVVEAEGLLLGIVHDAGPRLGRHERLRNLFPDCDLIAYGHTHEAEVVRHGGAWIVNPGSPTERRRSPAHTMAVVESGVPRLVEL
jgi:uncharacterized protein